MAKQRAEKVTWAKNISAWLAFSGSLLACQTAGKAESRSVRSQMLVTTEWLAQHLQDKELVVLCVSATPEFCSKGHIPGSRSLRLSNISITRDGIPNELPPVDVLQHAFEALGVGDNSRVVLYGERSNLLAARGYFTLDYLGAADNASLLDGGIEKWRAENRPVTDDLAPPAHGTLVPKVRPEVLADAASIKKVSAADKGVTVLDARPSKEFTGEQLSEEVAKAGHVPHAKPLYWMDLIVSPQMPVLKPEAELRHLFEERGARPGGEVITYCRTGMQSTMDYFVAKYLGYKASMYDGSFFEWSKQGLPVETSISK